MKEIKAFFVLVFGALSSWFGVLAIPMLILIALNITDYITGICASKYRGQQISSYIGFRGIAKKVCMWLLVAVGGVIDWLLIYAGGAVGIDIKFNYAVASIVCVWVICNEIISILENIKDIGVLMPDWLIKITMNIKTQVDLKVDDSKENNDE